MNARLDAFARQGENTRDLVDRQFLDIAQQDHLAVVVRQRLDGPRPIDANVVGREMRHLCLHIVCRLFRPSRRRRSRRRQARRATANAENDRA
jgi:hypothetical protein